MLRIPCPNCEEYCLTLNMEAYVVCPYCRISFSGKSGFSRRTEPRRPEEQPLVILCNGNTFKALTTDLSEAGLGILIFNGVPVKKKDILNLQQGDHSFMARVMWLNKQTGGTRVGLKKVTDGIDEAWYEQSLSKYKRGGRIT